MKLPKSLLVGLAAGIAAGAGATMFVLTAGDGGAPEKLAASNPSGGQAGARSGAQRPGGQRRGGYAPAVTMAMAEAASVGKRLDVIGEARALKSVSLTAEATGIVTEVNIVPGRQVSAGEILLRIDDEQQRIALERARAQYPIAKANAERYRELVETEAASALEAEAAFNNYKTLEADLRAAEFAIAQRTVRAPFDGVIGLTAIEPGDYLRAGDVVTTLDDMSSIVVEFAVPQEAANAVELDQAVEAQLASGGAAAFAGVVSAIDSRVDPVSRTLKIEAIFSNRTGRLLPGAIFAVSTVSRGAPAVSVPGLAIQWDRAGSYVWKRGADGAAMRAEVEILQRTDNIVLVAGEIEPGDAVVSEGADRVRAGVPLPDATRRRKAGGAPTASSLSAGTANGGE